MMMMRRRRRLWFRSGRWRRRGGRLARSSLPSVARAPPPSCSRSRSGGLGLSVATRARGAGPPSRRRQRRLRAAVHSRVLGAVAVGATGAAIAGAKIGALGTGRHRPGPKVLMVEVLACTRPRNGLTMVMSTLTRLPLPCSRLPGDVPGRKTVVLSQAVRGVSTACPCGSRNSVACVPNELGKIIYFLYLYI